MLREIFLVLVFTTFLVKTIKRYLKVRVLENIPGPTSLPLVGNSLDFIGTRRSAFLAFQRCCAEFGDGMMRMYLGLQPYVILYKAKYAETLLSNHQWIQKSRTYSYFEPWMNTGLLTSHGSKWHYRRKLLTPAFHFKILEDFIEVFDCHAKAFVQKLEKLCNGKPVDICPLAALCTLDVIIETALGNPSNFQNDSDNEYVTAALKMNELIQIRQTSPLLHIDFLYWLLGYKAQEDKCLKILHTMSMSNIQKRKKYYKMEQAETRGELDTEILGKKRRLAFLDLLIQESEKSTNPLTDLDLREEVDTFMFAGHDTTGTGLSFSLYWISRHPEIQDRIYEEVVEVVGDSENITLDHVRELKYLECCIKEALRLCPPAPRFSRCLNFDVEIGGKVIPAGTNIVVMAYTVHRDPDHFHDPLKYDPDRFLPEEVKKRHPYSYFPFSAGARNCIGQKFGMFEVKVVIASIIRNFKIRSSQTFEELSLLCDMILRPENGVFISFEKRK